MDNRSFLILSGQILIAVTIIASTVIITSSLKQIKFGASTIQVKGCAEKRIQSDFVKWQGSISASEASRAVAYDKFEKDLEILKQYLKKSGIALDTVNFSPIHSSVVHKRTDKGELMNEIETYTFSQDFTILSQDIPLVAKVSQNITTLIKEGLYIYSSAPEYFYTKIDELKIDMLSEASKDAKQRAEALVSKSGSHIGILRSAHQGVFQITPAFSTSVSDYGENDTSSIDKKIKAVVTMEYAIE